MKKTSQYLLFITAFCLIQSCLLLSPQLSNADIVVRPKNIITKKPAIPLNSSTNKIQTEEKAQEEPKQSTQVQEKEVKIVFSTNKVFHTINSLEFTQEFAISGFNLPESVASKASSHWVYVSNVNTSDDTGFISRVKKNGDEVEMNWLTGLTQPTGMIMKDRNIYIASQEKIYIVDSTRAKVTDTLKPKAKNIKNLNAIALDDEGTVYSSDIIAGKIFKQDGENLIEWFQSDLIKHPNALTISGNKLIVATYGSSLSKNLAPDEYGSIYSIDLFTRKIDLFYSSFKLGALESLHPYNNGFIATSATGHVYYIDHDNRILLLTLSDGITDAYISEDTLYIVYLKHNKLVSYKIATK